MQTLARESTAIPASARSAAYAVIGAGFRYPSQVPLAMLAAEPIWAGALAPLCARPDGLGRAARDLRSGVVALLGHSHAEDDARARLEEPYAAVFGHAVRGACPPYELEYGPGEIVQRAPDLADIAGFYAAFGMEAGAESERADHVTAECEFLCVLCAKEEDAALRGDTDAVELCVSAQRAFLRDHLSRWLPAFAQRVIERQAQGYYADLARFAARFVEAECGAYDVPLGPALLELRPADPERDSCIECGPETCVPGGGGASGGLVTLNVTARRK